MMTAKMVSFLNWNKKLWNKEMFSCCCQFCSFFSNKIVARSKCGPSDVPIHFNCLVSRDKSSKGWNCKLVWIDITTLIGPCDYKYNCNFMQRLQYELKIIFTLFLLIYFFLRVKRIQKKKFLKHSSYLMMITRSVDYHVFHVFGERWHVSYI